jgi:ketosteroid isomerase-like protein
LLSRRSRVPSPRAQDSVGGTDTSKEGRNAELVRSGYEALNRRDPGRILELMAPGAELRFRPPGAEEETLRGTEELASFYDALYQVFDHVHLECGDLEEGGATVHVRGTVTLRVRDTQQSTHASFRHTYKLRDGAVVSATFEDPVNPLELMRAAAGS